MGKKTITRSLHEDNPKNDVSADCILGRVIYCTQNVIHSPSFLNVYNITYRFMNLNEIQGSKIIFRVLD